MYQVIEYFIDLQDNGHEYKVGDKFPRLDLHVTEDRIQELCGADNLRGIPLIKKVETEKPKRKKDKKNNADIT